MSDSDSDDVVMIDPKDSSNLADGIFMDKEARPLMILFKRVMAAKENENILTTNAQILSILIKECNIDIKSVHKIELDIYLNIVKRYLKNWPKWDEINKLKNTLQKKKKKLFAKTVLEAKYIELKKYLEVKLEATKPRARKAVNDINKNRAEKLKAIDNRDITLHVQCSRKQLNELVLSQPVGNKILNLSETTPWFVILNEIPIEAVINWCSVEVIIKGKTLSFSRSTQHQLKRTIVNAKGGTYNNKRVLNGQLEVKYDRGSHKKMKKEKLLTFFEIMLQNENFGQWQLFLQSFMNVLKDDLKVAPDNIDVPASYRQHSNKYPYYRKLRKEVENMPPSNLYDLYLDETLAPMHLIRVNRINTGELNSGDRILSIKLRCVHCDITFISKEANSYEKAIEHFELHNAHEKDWTCTNCEKTFTMNFLAQNKWFHICN